MENSPPSPGRQVTLLGLLALWMGGWGFYFTYGVHQAFDQLVQRWVSKSTGAVTHGPRPWIEPWILTYCVLSALLMCGGGLGLLLRRRWGPALAALAGESWAISSLGFLLYHAGVLLLVVPKLPPGPATTWLQAVWFGSAGASVLTLLFGVLCVACMFRPKVREACGDVMKAQGSFLRLALGVWGAVSLLTTAVWAGWYWMILARF